MSRKANVLLAVFIVVFMEPLYNKAQNSPPQPAPPPVTYSSQVPTFGAGHDYIQMLGETVNPANGSVSLRLNVPVPKGRGPTPSFSLAYDSAGVYGAITFPPPAKVLLNGSGAKAGIVIGSVQASNPTQLSALGWTELIPSLSGSRSYFTNFAGTATCFYSQGFVFTDSMGQKHAFSDIFYDDAEGMEPELCSEYNPPLPSISNTINYISNSIDQTVKAAWVFGGTVTITQSDGTVYVFPYPFSNQGGGCFTVSGAVVLSTTLLCDQVGVNSVTPEWVEDKNGNRISGWSAADTLGRAALNITHSTDAGGYTATDISVSGNPSSYQINWGDLRYTGNIVAPVQLISGSPSSQSFPYFCTGDTTNSNSGSTFGYENTIRVPKSLNLPDGTSYQFQYDATSGLLSKLIYPNGAYVSYTWGSPGGFSDEAFYMWSVASQGIDQDYDVSWTQATCQYRYSLPVLLHRYVSFDGVNIAEQQDFSYSTGFSQVADAEVTWATKSTTVVTHDLLRGTSYSKLYNYVQGSRSPGTITHGDENSNSDTYFQSSGNGAVETSVVLKDSNGNVVQTTNKAWTGEAYPTKVQTVWPNQQTSEVDYNYGGPSLPQLVEKDVYDVGSGARGPLLQKTLINYAQFGTTPIFLPQFGASTATNPLAASLLSFPSSEIVYDGSGNRVAETDYGYDETPVTSVSATGHDDMNYGAGSSVPRANLTTITKRCFPNCVDAVTTMTYDDTGQVTSVKDPNGQSTGAVTQFSYLDNFALGTGQPTGNTNAYLTKITSPTVNGITQVSTAQYGFNDGLIRSVTDPNAQTTQFCYLIGGCSGSSVDPWLRLTQIILPDGGQQNASYVDTGNNPSTTITKLISAGNNETTTTIFDSMGHPTQKQMSDPCGTDYVDTTYDGEGRVWTSSNPYRNSSMCAVSETTGRTSFLYDPLGRKTQQNNPDSTSESWIYNGNSIIFSNESLQSWTRTTDGLGRLTKVVEPSLYTTNYLYDALGNLSSVSQIGNGSTDSPRMRSFIYDSLSHLVISTNPETGTICYGQWSGGICSGGYDTNGNLLLKTDARRFTTSYSYDALNRLLQTTVPLVNSSGVVANQYQSTCYQYDNIPGATASAKLVGHLAAEWTQSGNACAASYNPSVLALTAKVALGYDAMGRLQMSQQCIKGMCQTSPFTQNQTYDLAGNMTSWSDGRNWMNFSQPFDAAGRPVSVSNSVYGNGWPAILFSSPAYAPSNALQNWNIGGYLNFSRTYDNRLRVTGEAVTH